MNKIPKKHQQIIDKLKDNGYESYVVGGFVRDSLIGRKSDDIDISTSATVDEICKVFEGEKILDTGFKHGTVFMIIDGEQIEITTFREDGDYKDGRHPEKVVFTKDIRKDLSRRDFTINALAYDGYKLIDEFNGKRDLEKKLIRAVGDPIERFKEDALRMLRAVRFATTLGFSIEDRTLVAIRVMSENINKVSYERINQELNKILLSNASRGFKLLNTSGLLRYIIPELDRCVGVEQFNKNHLYDVFNHTLKALEYTNKDLITRLAVLLHDVGKPVCMSFDKEGVGHFYKHEIKGSEMAESILKRLRYDKNTVERVVRLIRNHMSTDVKTKKGVKKVIGRVGEDIDRLVEVMYADVLSSSLNPINIGKILRIKRLVKEIKDNKDPLGVSDLKVNGYDLMGIGLQGKEIGDALKKLLDKVLENPSINEKQLLLKEVVNIQKTH